MADPINEKIFIYYAVISAWISAGISLILIFTAISLWPEFDWLTRTLSNLGNSDKCAACAPFLNGAYIIAACGTFPLYTLVLITLIKTDMNAAKLGVLLILGSTVALGALGIATEYFDAHLDVSTSFFVLFVSGNLFTGISWILRNERRKFGIIALITVFIIGGVWIIDGSLPGGTFPKFWYHDAVPEFTSVSAYLLSMANLTVYILRFTRNAGKR